MIDPRTYKPSILFPDYEKQSDYLAKKDYLRGVMVGLAESGKLSVTDLMQQPYPIPDMCGEIIFGVMKSVADESHVGFIQEDMGIPDVLSSYRVTIEALPKATIQVYDYYEQTSHDEPWTVRCKLPARASRRWRTDANGRRHATVEYETQAYDSEKRITTEPLRMAWWILKQTGVLCKRARSKRTQAAFWKCREVFPREKASKPKPKRGPGRPPKSKPQEPNTVAA